MSFSFKELFFTLGAFFGLFILIYFGRSIMVPIAFGLLFSFILYPICKWLEVKGVQRTWAIIWTMLFITLSILGIIVLFSAQIINIAKEFGDFTEKINELLQSITKFFNNKVAFIPDITPKKVIEKGKDWVGESTGVIMGDTLSITSTMLSGMVMAFIYTFLLLLYRSGLTMALVSFATQEKKVVYHHMLKDIQKVGQQYLTGMGILILILGCLNSLGLFLIGIQYALFFGFLAAFLSVIPFIGTALGGLIPTLFALMNYDSIWYPLGVVIIFWSIQFIEGNFLSPKIVGGNLDLNALAAIFFLFLGASLWGIPGMILSLPFAAIFKEICSYYEPLQPVCLLLDGNVHKRKDEIKEKQNQHASSANTTKA